MCLKPCRECPYRKDSIPGYFGGNDSEYYLQAIHAEAVMPCHIRSKYDASGMVIVNKIITCRGQVLAQILSCKIPYNPDLLVARKELEESPEINTLKANNLSAFNFDTHHNAGAISS